MPHVTLYMPNGEQLLSIDVKSFAHSGNALVLQLEGADAEEYGKTVTTTLPYFIGSKSQE